MAIDLPTQLRVYKPENRERTRRAIASVVEDAVRKAGTEFISVAKVRQAGAKDQNAATACLRAWRAGEVSVADSWADPPPVPPPGAIDATPGPDARLRLAESIRAAKTDGDREAILHELAALVARGDVDPEEAREIRGPLSEARHAGEAKRSNEPAPEDPTKMLMASAEAMEAARAIDRIVDDARRDRVLALIAAELEADMIAVPNVDGGA